MTDAEFDYLFRDADPRNLGYYKMLREEYRKKHPQTNFEAWRDSLTPEVFAELMRNRCSACPLAYDNGVCFGPYCLAFCRDRLLTWASAPAKEEK